MKKILLLLTVLISGVLVAQDGISISTGIIGSGQMLGAKTTDNQTTVGVLGINSNGDTVVGSLTNKGVRLPALLQASEAVAGAGTTVADAAQLAGGATTVHRITGANGTVGWKFSTATPIGSVQILLNTTAGVAKIYGESGSTINGAAADAAFTALTGIKPIICIKTAALTYLCA